MGAKISNRYSYKPQPRVFKLFLNCFPHVPHKTTFGIFEVLKLADIFLMVLTKLRSRK